MKALNVSRICAFNDNYIWLIHSNNETNDKAVIIVDPGDSRPVLEFIKKTSLPSPSHIHHSSSLRSL